jgi:hypothetical protein
VFRARGRAGKKLHTTSVPRANKPIWRAFTNSDPASALRFARCTQASSGSLQCSPDDIADCIAKRESPLDALMQMTMLAFAPWRFPPRLHA